MNATQKPLYPEHDKLSAVNDKSQIIGEFLDWASNQGWQMMMWREDLKDTRDCPIMAWNLKDKCQPNCSKCGGTGSVEVEVDSWVSAPGSIQDKLAQFFGIDRDVLEAEKRAMLDSIREANP